MSQRVGEKRSRSTGRESNGHAPPRKQSRLDEEESDDVDDDSAGDFTFTQMQAQSQDEQEAVERTKEMKMVGEVGVIDMVQLTNFMCHNSLVVQFSPNVNFVLGRNGSGKSAILTGLVVALGGKARSTERGSSLKQFIKTGEKMAEVTVSLRNRGSESYRPEEYGDSITVVRQIRDDGTGSYKIKGQRGNIVSTKKEELLTILDHCSIQIDNPVSILSQDTSRNFLQKATPSDKYKLFMKATQLEQIATDYERASEDQKLMLEGIKRQELLVPVYREKAKKLEEKVQAFDKLKDMEQRVGDLEKELHWAIVYEIESSIPPIEESIVKDTGRIARNEEKLKKAKEALTMADKALKEVNKELNKKVDEATGLQAKRDSIVQEGRNKQKGIKEVTWKVKDISRNIKDMEGQKRDLEKARDECIIASQRDVSGEKERRLRELQEKEEKLRRVEAEIATADNDRNQFHNAVMRSSEMHKEKERIVSEKEGHVHECEQKLNRLKSGRQDRLAPFHANTRKVAEALEKNAHRFRHPPKGPIGREDILRLKDYRWSTAVEQVTKFQLLNAFIVDNEHDRVTYNGIVNRTIPRGQFKPECIDFPFRHNQVHDISRRRPRTDHMTVYDVLDVQDPIVMNVLIEQCNVETTLLIERRDNANHVMNHIRPQGASSAYTLDGDQVLEGRHYSNRHGRIGIIRASVNDVIGHEEVKLAGLRSELQSLRQEASRLRDEAIRNKRQVGEVSQRLRRKAEEKNQLKRSITELKNAQEEEETEVDTATYEAEVAELEEKIRELKEQREAHIAERNKLEGERKDCHERGKQVDDEVEAITVEMEELRARVTHHSNEKDKAKRRLENQKTRLKEINDSIAEKEAQVAEIRENARIAELAASENCDRVETKRRRKEVESEIRKLRKFIEERQPRIEEQDSIREEYTSAMEKYKETMAKIKQEKAALKRLADSLRSRMKGYESLQERIISRARVFFTYFLRQRDYDGKIKFLPEKERLEIHVQVDRHTDKAKGTKNTKSLSGGERSFTTVCFIMALWDTMEAPFRCLDEFDVFMDMMNRKISMRLMMDHSQDNLNKQFIFFTPQDMSAMGIRTGANIKVFRLSEPERGQTTLNFASTSSSSS